MTDPYLRACKLVDADDARGLERLLAADPSLATAERDGTLLHRAVLERKAECARLLLRLAPDTAVWADRRGFTPVHLAARFGALDILDAILEAAPEAALAGARGGQTPLMFAVKAHQQAAAEVLLRAAPQTATMLDDLGQLPLHAAAWSGRLPVLNLLLAAAPEAAFVATDFGSTPLHFAAARGRPAFVRKLLAAAPGAADVLDGAGMAPLHHAASLRSKSCAAQLASALVLELADHAGMTPLHHAAFNRSPGCVEMLLALAPATATAVDGRGMTPLMAAAVSGAGTGTKEEMARCVRLLASAAPAAIGVASRDPDDGILQTPLHALAGIGQEDAVRSVLTVAPAAALVPDELGRLPLHVAAEWGRDACVRLLVAAAPATAAALDGSGQTPAQLAVASEFYMHVRTAGTVLLAAMRAVPRPLTDAEWQLVPWQHADLLATLPAALRLSDEQAGRVVTRLPPADRDRVRAAACALRLGSRTCPSLPPELVRLVFEHM